MVPIGDVLATFHFVNQLPGMVDLLRRELRVPAKLHAAAPRGPVGRGSAQ